MRYQAPATIAETTALLHSADGTARILAGGTDLIPQMQARRQVPELVVEVTFDHVSDGRIRHGAKIQRWREDKDPSECSLAQLEQ